MEDDGSSLRFGRVPNRTFRYSYKDDLLRIRSLTIDDSVGRAAPHVTEDLFSVPPVYRDLRPEEAADTTLPSLNARWLCNYFLVRFANGEVVVLTKIAHQAQQQRWVRFEEFTDGVKVMVSQEFFEEMGRAVLREFRQF